MTQSLKGKNILVTGASKGIGAAIVKKIAAEGAKVIIHYGHNQDAAHQLLDEIHGNGWIVQADLTQPHETFNLWEKALEAAGQIHAVVNNAGIRTEVTLDASTQEWQAVWQKEFQVNFFAAADLSKQAITHFKANGGGRIINITSRAGQRGYTADALPYGCSKAALINLTKSIARSFGADGITAVAIAPGWVLTEMAENFISVNGQQAAVAEIPIGQLVETEELAELVAFTLRPTQVSLNGATLDINGGSYIR